MRLKDSASLEELAWSWKSHVQSWLCCWVTLGPPIASLALVPLPVREDDAWKGHREVGRGSSFQHPRVLRVPESQKQPCPETSLAEEGIAQHPYHVTLRAQRCLTPPSRDPAEIRGMAAAQCGPVGGTVAGVWASALAWHT